MNNEVLHEHPLGLTWTIEDRIERSAHALVDDGRVWLIDPMDSHVALERAQTLGKVVAVIQLLDRHNRDCAAVAARFGVPHLANPDAVPDSPFEVVQVVNGRKWKETALWWPQHRALVISEAIGTGKAFTGGRLAGVHPVLRFKPPRRKLTSFTPEHLLVGHGPPLHGVDAAEALTGAFRHTRRNIPRMLVGSFRNG